MLAKVIAKVVSGVKGVGAGEVVELVVLEVVDVGVVVVVPIYDSSVRSGLRCNLHQRQLVHPAEQVTEPS